jgi:hypothetical protein
MRGTIEQFQNADGGWPYGIAGPSWTEPTALALLAQLSAGGEVSPSVERGLRWLRTVQSADGGWRPEPSVKQSTWVSALVALLPGKLLAEDRQRANLEWLLRQTGQESTWLFRIRRWMIGNVPVTNNGGDGWPWYPGAAAWVTPTAITILALQKQRALLPMLPKDVLESRIAEGQHFLLTHACASGGWNHGAAQALGYQANPYPETTGLALLALRDAKSPVKDAGIKVAERFLPGCRSAEGNAWLRLGLRANGCTVPAPDSERSEPRTTVDLALMALADRAQSGTNSFVV